MSSAITPETRKFLQFVSQARKEQLKSLFCYATVKQLNAVFEIILNYLAGNIQQDRKFDNRKSLFKTLTSKKLHCPERDSFCVRAKYIELYYRLLLNYGIKVYNFAI